MTWLTVDEMLAIRAEWRKKPTLQIWQAKNPGSSEFHDLPLNYEPGWFFDTEYRPKPEETKS